MRQKWNAMLVNLYTKTLHAIEDERGEVNIVTIVVLIGIAVLLALIFKGKITELLDSLFGEINNQATSAVK